MKKAKAKPKKQAPKKRPVAKKPEAAAPVPQAPTLKTIQVNAKYLRALRHVAPQHDIRYYLNAVLLQAKKDGGKFYVATDGHRIAVLHENWGNGEEPQDLTILLPRVVCAKATPILKQSTMAVLKQVDEWTWNLRGASEVQQTFRAIDGKYPEWERVVPDAASGAVGAFNWSYLHEFNLVAKEAFGARYSVELQHNGDGAALVTCGTNDFLGLVMPMRMSGGSLPQWALAIQKENVKRKAVEKLEQEKRDRAAANADKIAEAA